MTLDRAANRRVTAAVDRARAAADAAGAELTAAKARARELRDAARTARAEAVAAELARRDDERARVMRYLDERDRDDEGQLVGRGGYRYTIAQIATATGVPLARVRRLVTERRRGGVQDLTKDALFVQASNAAVSAPELHPSRRF